MESISSLQNGWESFQSRFGWGNAVFSLVDLNYEHADIVAGSSPVAHVMGTGTGQSRRGNAADPTTTTTTTTLTRINVLVPPFDAPARKLQVPSATILLVTMIGTHPRTWHGLAWALHTSGIVVTTLFLILGALWSQRALQLLAAAVRKSGVISYAEVAWIAFSYRAELVVASLLHVYLLSYMVQQLYVMRTLLQELLVSRLHAASMLPSLVWQNLWGDEGGVGGGGGALLLLLLLLNVCR